MLSNGKKANLILSNYHLSLCKKGREHNAPCLFILLPINRYFAGIAGGRGINVVHTAFPNHIPCSVYLDKFVFYLSICRHTDIIEPSRIYADRRCIVKQRPYRFRRIPASEFRYAAYNLNVRSVIRSCIIHLKANRYLSTRQNIESCKCFTRCAVCICYHYVNFSRNAAGDDGLNHTV